LKEEAKLVYKEAIKENRTAIIGRSLPNGLSKFVVGNLPSNTFCEVYLNCVFTSQLLDSKTIFLKFPLKVSTKMKFKLH
jgi:hypothetical protein